MLVGIKRSESFLGQAVCSFTIVFFQMALCEWANRGETVCSLALGLAVSLMAAFPKLFLGASQSRDPYDSKEAAAALP